MRSTIDLYLKKISVGVFVLLGGIVLGTLLLTLVYCLPTEVMDRNVRSSIDIFYTESVYPMQVQGYKSTQLDNETDAVMLLGAIYDGGGQSALERALKVERVDFEETHSLCVDLIQYAWEEKIPDDVDEYSRYWHGYMVWLKPMLSFFDYADIRMFNMILQISLLVILVVSFCEAGLKKYLLPLVMSLVIVNPIATAMSMQFSSIYGIVLITMILILKFHETWERKKLYPYVFLILGMVTVYFDFLTYPTAAFCMPMALVLILNKDSWKEKMKELFLFGTCFAIGYAGMWSGKWIVSSIILQEDIISTVLGQFNTHTGNPIVDGVEISKWGALVRNIKILCRWPYVATFIGAFIYSCIKINWKQFIENIYEIIPFLCIALVPIIWILITSSHATHCYFYAYRGFMTTLFCGFASLTLFGGKNVQIDKKS